MANQFTKYTGNVTGQVGSLITALNAALVTGQGWTSPFTGTNLATYRAPSGNQLYLYVDDSGSGTGGAKEALVTGYESMTAVPPGGTNPFPTATQQSGGGVLRKSATADATARAYQIYADARTFYMFILSGDNSATFYSTFGFGEIYSLVNSDLWNTIILGRTAQNSALYTASSLPVLTSAPSGTCAGNYLARAYNGLPNSNGSLLCGKMADYAKDGNAVAFGAGGTSAMVYPNSADGGLYVSPVWINEVATKLIRGRMRGLWAPCHAATNFNDGDTFSGTGDLAGKTFAIIKSGYESYGYVIETSATLETN